MRNIGHQYMMPTHKCTTCTGSRESSREESEKDQLHGHAVLHGTCTLLPLVDNAITS